MRRTNVAVIGSGNIGTDLMIKVLRLSQHLEMGAMVGIDPESDGLRRAQRLGVPTTAGGVRRLLDMPEFDDIAVVFEAVEINVAAMVDAVANYVPGYRLKQQVQFRRLETDDAAAELVDARHGYPSWQVTAYLEVEGAAHYLPAYAGNLDIMTSAALRVGESLAARTEEPVP
jgi:acetaldehyde dehydrogenase (acetylating)